MKSTLRNIIAVTFISIAYHGLPAIAGASDAQLLTPAPLAANVELHNPFSGLYMNLPQNSKTLELHCLNNSTTILAPVTGLRDEYTRMSWHSLEPSEGQYDFSFIEKALTPCTAEQAQNLCTTPASTVCLPKGNKFSFRLMALNSQIGGNTNISMGSDGYPVYSQVPNYIMQGKHGWLLPVNPTDATKGHYFIPDWNDPVLLQRMSALLAALGKKYDGDPRIGWIDIGLYGNWGEGHTQGLTVTAKPPRSDNGYSYANIPYDSSMSHYDLNKQAYLQNTGHEGAYAAGTAQSQHYIVDAHIRAFPHTQLAMTTGNGESLCYAMNLPGEESHIGLRRDNIGSGPVMWSNKFPNLPGCSSAGADKITNRWKTAPFVTETAMTGPLSTNACRTFSINPATNHYYINEEIVDYHVASVKNQSCPGTWSQTPQSEQDSFTLANLMAGYRFGIGQVNATADKKTLTLQTSWTNAGVTPAYNDWNVEFSLWNGAQETVRFMSQVNLRKILPTGNSPVVISDAVTLNNTVKLGSYQLKVRVTDPKNYLNPMELAIDNGSGDGYYPLGTIVIP